MTIPALILAGSRDGARDPMAQLRRVSHKALLPVGGRPMIDRVLETLSSTPGIGPLHISIETPEVLTEIDRIFACVPAANGPSGSVALAMDRLGTPLMITTADHPLLQSRWIKEFVSEAEKMPCDIAVGVALRSVIERDIPATKRTYINLQDMTFSGCNLFLLRTSKAKAVVTLWQHLERDRKRPLRMARHLGLRILSLALLGRLSSEALTARIGALTGAKLRLIPIDDGRAAIDVDKPHDLTLVEHLLADLT